MSIKLSRKKINDMVDRNYSTTERRKSGGSGSAGGGGGSLPDEVTITTLHTERIYLANDVYLYTDGSDLKLVINATTYTLTKTPDSP